MSPPLRFLPLGVGDAFTAIHFTCCVAVEYDGAWLLIDCPHPIRRMIRDGCKTAGVEFDIGDVAAVCLTHLHADHCSGLEGYGFYNHFYLQKDAPVVCHPDVRARVWDDMLAAGMDSFGLEELGETPGKRGFEDYFDHLPVSEGAPVEVGPFTIECKKTVHPIPTTAFRVSAGGKSIGHSSDTFYDRDLIDWLAEADLVIHETNYGIHTKYEDLAALPEDLRAKMRLIHFPDEFDHAASVIETLEQGRLYTVG